MTIQCKNIFNFRIKYKWMLRAFYWYTQCRNTVFKWTIRNVRKSNKVIWITYLNIYLVQMKPFYIKNVNFLKLIVFLLEGMLNKGLIIACAVKTYYVINWNNMNIIVTSTLVHTFFTSSLIIWNICKMSCRFVKYHANLSLREF